MAVETRTEHPHIVRTAGVAGGQPIIAGTRISVAFIAQLLQGGEQPADIIAAYPDLPPAAVYDAISYHLDHREEIDRFLNATTPEALAARYGYTVGDKGQVVFTQPPTAE